MNPLLLPIILKIEGFGYHILEPETGFLASGLDGKGRLPEISAILKKSSEIIGDVIGPLFGKKYWLLLVLPVNI